MIREWLAVLGTVVTVAYLNAPQSVARYGEAHYSLQHSAPSSLTASAMVRKVKGSRDHAEWADRVHARAYGNIVSDRLHMHTMRCGPTWYPLDSSTLHVQRCEFVYVDPSASADISATGSR